MTEFDEVGRLQQGLGFAGNGNGAASNGALGAVGIQDKQPALLQPVPNCDAGAAAYFAQLRRRVSELLQQRSRQAAIQVLQAGIYCLEGFVQSNVCGPIEKQHAAIWQTGTADSNTSKQSAGIGQDTLSADERWVVLQLEVDGEELIGRVQGLDLLLAALVLLAEPYGTLTTAASVQQDQQQQQQPDSEQPQQVPQIDPEWLQQQRLGSWCWWAMRVVMQQQHVLHGRSNTLQNALKQLMQQTLEWVQSLSSSAAAAEGECQSSNSTISTETQQMLAAAAHLECALVHQHYGQVVDAQQQLDAAAEVLGVTVQVTGALGFRTKHQLDAKPQLVAAVKGPAKAGNGHQEVLDAGLDVATLGFEEIGASKELEGMEDDSAVYLAPRLAANSNASTTAAGAAAGTEPGAAVSSNLDSRPQQQQQQTISCMQQALLLSWASQIKKGTSKDELQQWQMAPFVEAVLQQRYTQYMLHATARLLKCRHEKERGRTRERSLMQLEQLCSAVEGLQPPGVVRLPYLHAVRFPLWPLLQKELAELYIGMGFVGAALKIFEALEMWDQLIVCYRLLDKKQVAQELVQQRLQANPSDAKLWCVLGDIQQQDQHYHKAWEVSKHRSSRAQRSLARSALQRKEYEQAMAAYELALGLNPLYPDAWFSLGYCYLKLGQIRKALQAFTKVTQLEYDHGEAWTNLAALWLQEGGWSEALHASEQAVKYKRDSWQTWDNYATAAVKAGSGMAAVRGLSQVFELTNGERLSVSTAEQLMNQLEQEAAAIIAAGSSSSTQPLAAAGTSAPPAAATAAAVGEDSEGEVMEAPDQLLSLLQMSDGTSVTGDATLDGTTAAAAARVRSHDQVMQLLGQLLKSVANSSACSPAVWGVYARWFGVQGQLLSSQEARLKQVRALQSTPFKSDPGHFAVMAAASMHLCRAYMASAAAGQGGLRDLSAARMHLRGVLKQCEERFENEQLYKEMQDLLQEILVAEDAALAAKRAAEAAA